MPELKPTIAKFMLYFGFFMAVVYVILGLFVLLSAQLDYIPSQIKFVFGFFFIAYGLFRLVRSVLNLKQNQNHEI